MSRSPACHWPASVSRSTSCRICAHVIAVTSAPGGNRTASNSAVHEVRPVSSAATNEYGQPGIIRCSSLPRLGQLPAQRLHLDLAVVERVIQRAVPAPVLRRQRQPDQAETPPSHRSLPLGPSCQQQRNFDTAGHGWSFVRAACFTTPFLRSLRDASSPGWHPSTGAGKVAAIGSATLISVVTWPM